MRKKMVKYLIEFENDSNIIKRVTDLSEMLNYIPGNDKISYKILDTDTPPDVGEEMSRDYKNKRKVCYEEMSDPLFLEYIAQKEEGAPQEDIDSAKQAWIDKKQEIKDKYPKP